MPMSDDMREREFDACQSATWGWDGYHVEDAVSFAVLFRDQRNDARAECQRLAAENARLRGMLKTHGHHRDGCAALTEDPGDACDCGLMTYICDTCEATCVSYDPSAGEAEAS